MFATKTVSIDELHAAFLKNPADTFYPKERKPKDGKKYKLGTAYMENQFKTLTMTEPKNVIIYASGIHISKGPANIDDPNDTAKDYITDSNKDERKIDISGSRSGLYGPTVRLFQEERHRQTEEMIEKSVIDASVWKGHKYCQMYRTHMSSEGSVPEKFRGKEYKDKDDKPDYRIALALDFSLHPNEKYVPEKKRGQVKTVVKDFRTARVVKDSEGNDVIEYDLAMVDGQLINALNAYKFITPGSIIEEMYVSWGSTSKSKQGISTKQVVEEIVINPQVQVVQMERKTNTDLIKKIQESRAKAANTEVKTETKTETKVETKQEEVKVEDPSKTKNINNFIDNIK